VVESSSSSSDAKFDPWRSLCDAVSGHTPVMVFCMFLLVSFGCLPSLIFLSLYCLGAVMFFCTFLPKCSYHVLTVETTLDAH